MFPIFVRAFREYYGDDAAEISRSKERMQNKMKKLLHWFNGIKLRYKLAIFYSLVLLFAGDAFVFG